MHNHLSKDRMFLLVTAASCTCDIAHAMNVFLHSLSNAMAPQCGGSFPFLSPLTCNTLERVVGRCVFVFNLSTAKTSREMIINCEREGNWQEK